WGVIGLGCAGSIGGEGRQSSRQCVLHPSLDGSGDPLAPKARLGEWQMANETTHVAEYAARCRYEDIPPDVVERAKQCIADTIATVIFGYDLPWSRIVVAFAQKNGTGGKSRILGRGGAAVHAPAAALGHGAPAHAFEMGH